MVVIGDSARRRPESLFWGWAQVVYADRSSAGGTQVVSCRSVLMATGGAREGYAILETMTQPMVPPVPSLFTLKIASTPLLKGNKEKRMSINTEQIREGYGILEAMAQPVVPPAPSPLRPLELYPRLSWKAKQNQPSHLKINACHPRSSPAADGATGAFSPSPPQRIASTPLPQRAQPTEQ